MLVYAEEKKSFMAQTRDNRIFSIVKESVSKKLGMEVGRSEKKSWQNSLHFMRDILDDQDIPDDAGIAIEYKIPVGMQRIDFIVSGYDQQNKGNIVIIELKQWESVDISDKDAHVRTYREMLHPSYQAWTYKTQIENYNSAVKENDIGLYPCAYLHNYFIADPNEVPVIRNNFYDEYLKKAPVFLMNDSEKLRDFIKKYVKKGDKKQILYCLEKGKIKPSKNLANSLASMLKGNKEFILIDDQKTVFETALNLSEKTDSNNQKQVLIVKGGPGTGKSVVAINLLVKLTQLLKTVQYVTSNAAPRTVYGEKLSGSLDSSKISFLFQGSTVYKAAKENEMDALIVDEAHRLSFRNLLNTYHGNQVYDLIKAAKLTVFFLDEGQKVLIEDIGSESEIISQAEQLQAEVTIMELPSQFRCNGSDGYLAWIDNTLRIRDTANNTLAGIDYDFRVVDSPMELHDLIRKRNSSSERQCGSRLVAGYCWPWLSKKDSNAMDITIGNYSAQWNKSKDGSLWAIKEDTINEVGCIHTCQGLEFDYVGVIIGADLTCRDGNLLTKPEARNHVDANKTLRGYKTLIKSKDSEIVEKAKKDAREIILNTYKVLMTRGQKGCYIYCCDQELSDYFKSRINEPMYLLPGENQELALVSDLHMNDYID